MRQPTRNDQRRTTPDDKGRYEARARNPLTRKRSQQRVSARRPPCAILPDMNGPRPQPWPDPAVERVRSREDLADFLAQLAGRMREGMVQLENPSSADFVDAAARWSRAMPGFYKNVMNSIVPDEPDWAMIAAIFAAGVVYE